MIATTRKRNGRLELVVADIVVAVEGGYLFDVQLVVLYDQQQRTDGIPGAGRYWTPPLLRYAADRINAHAGKQQSDAAALKDAYLNKRTK
jgi:hypothetical protein